MGKMIDELFTQYQAGIDTDRIDKIFENKISLLDISYEEREKLISDFFEVIVEHEKQAFALGYSVSLFMHDEAKEVFKKNTQEG